jgi:hypothetical protein
VFDGYAIEANDSYIKVGLVPAGTAELWGSGFTGTSVNGLSLSRLRLNVSGNTADAVGYITFRTGVGGDIYPVGSFSSAVTSYQSGRLTKQLSGDLQVSYSGEINPINATEVWSAPNGVKLTSRIGGNGQFYQHQFAYQGQTLTHIRIFSREMMFSLEVTVMTFLTLRQVTTDLKARVAKIP